MAKLLASSSQPFPAFCIKHLSPPTPGQLQAASPSQGDNRHPTKGPGLEKGELQQGRHSDDLPQGRHHSAWEGQCSHSAISMGVVGEGLAWGGITDLCPLAPLQRRVPRPRTPCSRPTRECSNMQVVSTRACPLLPQPCSSPPRPGPGTVREGEVEGGRGGGELM